MANKGGGRS